MRDFKYDQTTCDMVITEGEVEFVSDVDLVAQRVVISVSILQGEDPWDTSFGIPTWASVLGKISNIRDVRGEIAKLIESIPGVKAVSDLTIVNDAASETRTISGTILAMDGSSRPIEGTFA